MQCCTVNCVQMYNVSCLHFKCTSLHCLVQLTVHFCCTVHCAKMCNVHACTSNVHSISPHCLALRHVYFNLCTALHCTVQLLNMCAVLSNTALQCTVARLAQPRSCCPHVGQQVVFATPTTHIPISANNKRHGHLITILFHASPLGFGI